MKRILLTLATLLTFGATASADQCIDWSKTMTMVEVGMMQNWKKSVLLQSFDDFTKVAGDDWLAQGIPALLADYLSTGKDINVLFGPMARFTPSSVSPTYTISGMFQHTDGTLRVFIKILEGGDLLKQLQLNIPYPQNKQFFEQLADAALQILAIASPHYDNEKFKAIKSATPSVPAYQNYIRGILTYENFDPDKFEIAKTWFDESKKADINYTYAYKGMMDLLTFMALYNKQQKKPYGVYLEQMEKEWNLMLKFKMRPPLPDFPKKYMIKDKGKVEPLTNRFLIGNGFFVAGLNAAGQKNWLEAANQFEYSLAHVPEDAITWYHLSQMREKTGDARKAAEARVKAFEINKCLQ